MAKPTLPTCKGANTTGKRANQPCRRNALPGYDGYCAWHYSQRIRTPQQETDKATALALIAELQEALKGRLSLLFIRSHIEKITADIDRKPNVEAWFVETARLPKAEATRKIEALAAWLHNLNKAAEAPFEEEHKADERLLTTATGYDFQTAQEFDALFRSQSDGPARKNWHNDAQALTRTYVHPDIKHHHYVQVGLTEKQIEFGLSLEDLERLTDAQGADAILTVLYVARALVPVEPLPRNTTPAGWFKIDDIIEKIGWDPRSTEERQEMRTRVWDYLRFGERARVIGQRTIPYYDKDGREIETRVDSPFWKIMGEQKQVQMGLLSGLEVPLVVELALSSQWTQMLLQAAQYLHLGEVIGSIPGNKPAGANARVIGLALATEWRVDVKKALAGETHLTRRQILNRYRAKGQTIEEMLYSTHAGRGIECWYGALQILVEKGILAKQGEAAITYTPQKEGRKAAGWQKNWLDAKVDINPGEPMQPGLKEVAEKRYEPQPRDLSQPRRQQVHKAITD